MTYEVTLRDEAIDLVDDADAYQQEGQMTTFFQHGSGRGVLDAWSTRIASYRTSEIVKIRRVGDNAATPSRRILALSHGAG